MASSRCSRQQPWRGISCFTVFKHVIVMIGPSWSGTSFLIQFRQLKSMVSSIWGSFPPIASLFANPQCTIRQCIVDWPNFLPIHALKCQRPRVIKLFCSLNTQLPLNKLVAQTVRVIWNAEKGVDVDAGDGVDVEIMLSWWCGSRGRVVKIDSLWVIYLLWRSQQCSSQLSQQRKLRSTLTTA